MIFDLGDGITFDTESIKWRTISSKKELISSQTVNFFIKFYFCRTSDKVMVFYEEYDGKKLVKSGEKSLEPLEIKHISQKIKELDSESKNKKAKRRSGNSKLLI